MKHLTLLESITSISIIQTDRASLGVIKVAGWVRTKRSSKKLSFIELNDGTHPTSLQIVIDSSIPNYHVVESLLTGCAITVCGELVLSPGKGQKYELQGKAVELLGHIDPETYPLQKKDMTFEYLRDVAHLRARTATFASVFRLRSIASLAIHEFFKNRGFHYVHTPILTAIDAEGAGESFHLAGDFFGDHTMLCVTGQLEAEALIMGLGKVYTFGPTFRAENSNTSRHLAEFWMIEPEVAFASLTDNMELAQDLIRFVVQAVLDKGADDLAICHQKSGQSQTLNFLQNAITTPFVRVSYTEAVKILTESQKSFEFPVFWGCDLKSEHERFLCEEHFQAPTIVYDYPEELKAFYMYLNDDGKTVRAMDILMPGIGEVVGGSQREDREDVLKARMEKKGINTHTMDWYLALRRFGSVPHAGFGMGLERLLIWMTGMSNVRDVIPFPRTPGNCKF
jgi:asparaginyl-tRNA synthetase